MSSQFERLVKIMADLRGPDGCPWDREQTHETLAPYLVEETYEVIEAIDSKDEKHLADELGDLLLQVVFHSQLSSEKGGFTIEDVCKAISDKLVRRHPHVFAESTADTPGEVIAQWEEIKKSEKTGPDRTSALSGVPKSMPALLKAMKIQKKAAHAGFDWKNIDGPLEKLHEEIGELDEAVRAGERKDIEDEMGDLLFSMVNVARFLKIDPERSLNKSIAKFRERFAYIEKKIEESGSSLDETGIDRMEELWVESKREVQNDR